MKKAGRGTCRLEQNYDSARSLRGRFVGFEEALEVTDARGVAEFAQAFGFDLADAFAGDFELLADFFQRAGVAVDEAEAQFENLALAFGEAAENILKLAFEKAVA